MVFATRAGALSTRDVMPLCYMLKTNRSKQMLQSPQGLLVCPHEATKHRRTTVKKLTQKKEYEMKAKALPQITIKDLEWNSGTRTYEWITRAVEPVFMRPNGDIVLSAEDYPQVADYYGELSDGLPWIAPELERWAEDNGGFWEWESAGSLVFCED